MIGMYEYDYLFSRPSALALTFLIPLAITLFQLSTFITVIAITGAIAGGLQGIIIISAFWKPEFMVKENRNIT